MTKQKEKNEEDALIAIVRSIREECRVVHKNRQISTLDEEADLKKSSETMENTINNDSFTNASNSVMPRSIYEYPKLANLGGATMSNEIAGQTNPLLDKEGLTKRWHVCKPVQVFYDDRSGEDCRMCPTCDPDSSFCYGYKEVFGKSEHGMLRQWVCFRDHERRTVKGSCMGFANFLQVRYGNQRIDDTTRERRYYEWVAQNYEFDNKRTPSKTTVFDKCPYKTNYPTPNPPNEWDTRCQITYTGSTFNQNIPNNDPTSFSLEHSELGEKTNISESPKLQPFRLRPCDYSFDEWLKVKIGHTNIYNSEREIVFNEWILDSFDVEEEYAKEIGNPYAQRFDKYKRVFDNEVENLSNGYTLRIGKKVYVLDDVWKKCEQYHKKVIDSWHDIVYEEEELWRSGDEKTDYEPPFVDVKTLK
ncbi:hypothetical protein Tco_0156027 [Tanacetum coccineum]